MEIRSIQGPQGLDALGATAAPPPQPPETPASKALDPAVKLDIRSDAYESRFVRDTDTSAIVFQVVESASGDVVDQLPSESALRNRAYASSGARTADSGAAGLSRVA